MECMQCIYWRTKPSMFRDSYACFAWKIIISPFVLCEIVNLNKIYCFFLQTERKIIIMHIIWGQVKWLPSSKYETITSSALFTFARFPKSSFNFVSLLLFFSLSSNILSFFLFHFIAFCFCLSCIHMHLKTIHILCLHEHNHITSFHRTTGAQKHSTH